MEHWQIVFLDSGTVGADIDLSCLSTLGTVTSYTFTAPDLTPDRIQSADIVVTNRVQIGEQELRNAPRLKLIALTATGVNNIDLAAARSLGVAVCNVAGYSTTSVAQHTFALVLSLVGQIPYHDHYVKSGEYTRSGASAYLARPSRELQHQRWGIIGLGAIGSAVAQIAESFGCNVRFYSASGRTTHERFEHVPLETLLKESDIVSIHAPLTEHTRGLIGTEQIACMQDHALLLNLARGGIVDEQAVADALDRGDIGGAAFDVFETEPPDITCPLLNLEYPKRIILTPHTAWSSNEARTRLVHELCENIHAFSRGEPRSRVV